MIGKMDNCLKCEEFRCEIIDRFENFFSADFEDQREDIEESIIDDYIYSLAAFCKRYKEKEKQEEIC